jgi:hypothetical protein
MPYFPIIDSGNPRQTFLFAGYRAVLLDRICSSQRIQYYFVLVVFRGEELQPCLAVASEYSSPESKAEPFLGVFPGEGHLNLGMSARWFDIDQFTNEALRQAIRHLNLPHDVEVLVGEPRRKPWWKFW